MCPQQSMIMSRLENKHFILLAAPNPQYACKSIFADVAPSSLEQW